MDTCNLLTPRGRIWRLVFSLFFRYRRGELEPDFLECRRKSPSFESIGILASFNMLCCFGVGRAELLV
jgi:hypothetical protein